MKLRHLLLPLLFATAAHAELDAKFNHFAIGKDGMWESTTTVLDGPQQGKVITGKNCINAEQSKAGVEKMMAMSKMATQCKTTVTLDTADSATSEQVCNFGPVTTKITSQLKRIDADSYEMMITMLQGGANVTHTRTVNKYTGPCTPTAPKPEDKAAAQAQCQQCKANLVKAKASCETQPAQAKTMCQSMVGQTEAACVMVCQ